MTPIRFGTDGIRGPAHSFPIDEATAAQVGAAAVRLAQTQGSRTVVVGRDTRPSGDTLTQAVVDGICAAGGIAMRAGVVPTAAVGLAVADGLAGAGVIVTASHNPASDNGFKVFGAHGSKLDDTQQRVFERWLNGRPVRQPGGDARDAPAVASHWRARLVDAAGDLGALRKKRLAVDLANGAATVALPWLREWLPAELIILGAEGRVNDGVGSEQMDALCQVVVRESLDGGVAFDGDADRCRLVDEHGNVVPGDAVTWRLAKRAPGRGVAVTVMSNGAIEGLLPGERVVRTAVGDRHLGQAMREHGLALGAEESGHILFDDYPAGDGMLAAVRALSAAWSAGGTLSEAFSGFEPWAQRAGKIRASDRPPLESLAMLQRVVAKQEHLLGESGRIFLRYSGTEPVLRVLVEGLDGARVEQAFDAVCVAAAEALA